jgi:hypothetical protein
MEIQVVGGSYSGRVKNVNSQRCVNMFPYPDPTGKKIISLHHTPGLVEWFDLSATVPIRGMHTFNDILYVVAGATLYKITATAGSITKTTIGTILTDTGKRLCFRVRWNHIRRDCRR